MSTGLALPPELWGLTLKHLCETSRQDELIFLWTTLRHVCRQFKATVEDVFRTQHLPRTFLHFKSGVTCSAYSPNLRSVNHQRRYEEMCKFGLCRFDFAGLDPSFSGRANFTFYNEDVNLGWSHARLKDIKHLAGPGRLGEADKGLVQVRGGLDDCAMPILGIDPKKRVISLEWKDLFTRFFGGKMVAARVLGQAPTGEIEVPSSPPLVQSSHHEPMQAYCLLQVRPSLQAFGRGDIETMLQDRHIAQVHVERLHRLTYPIQTWRATAEGNHGNTRMSIPNCRRRREADLEINFNDEGDVDMTTIDAEIASGQRIATATQNRIRRANTCDTCRELNMECEGCTAYGSNPCGTCILNKVQCEGTLAQVNRAMSSSLSENHAQQDYQMQLMLLEQQNKRRLLRARAEQDTVSSSAVQSTQEFAGSSRTPFSRDHPSTCAAQHTANWVGHRQPMIAGAPAITSLQNPARQEYNMQLMLLEQQNKARLLQARAQQHNTFSPVVQPTQGSSGTTQSTVALGPAVVPQ